MLKQETAILFQKLELGFIEYIGCSDSENITYLDIITSGDRALDFKAYYWQ
jgi:hypothetical protein